QKNEAFFNLWTRKEALLKATGEGIGELLNQVQVSFLSGEDARLLRLPSVWRGAETDWSLTHLSPASGYLGALAVSGKVDRVNCRPFQTTIMELPLSSAPSGLVTAMNL